MQFSVTTIQELHSALASILDACKKSNIHVLTLAGPVGAGKTTSVQHIAALLGCTDSVTSPTYVIMKTYSLPPESSFRTLTHIDAYRVEESDEMRVLGIDAHLSSASDFVCIEWPEHIPDILKTHASVRYTHDGGDARTLTYEEHHGI